MSLEPVLFEDKNELVDTILMLSDATVGLRYDSGDRSGFSRGILTQSGILSVQKHYTTTPGVYQTPVCTDMRIVAEQKLRVANTRIWNGRTLMFIYSDRRNIIWDL